jgi:hypothetical protein
MRWQTNSTFLKVRLIIILILDTVHLSQPREIPELENPKYFDGRSVLRIEPGPWPDHGAEPSTEFKLLLLIYKFYNCVKNYESKVSK